MQSLFFLQEKMVMAMNAAVNKMVFIMALLIIDNPMNGSDASIQTLVQRHGLTTLTLQLFL